jgi:cold shock CspA family protein
VLYYYTAYTSGLKHPQPLHEREKTMQKGTVKFFLPQNSKRYGFIIVEDGSEIFFHFNQGEEFRAGTTKPIFSGRMQTRDPKTEDEVLFEIKIGRNGPKADPWGFAEDYERVEAEMSSTTVYRVRREHSISGNDKKTEPTVLWKGSDIEDLCSMFPRLKNHRMDELKSHFTFDDLNTVCSPSDYVVRIWFEQLTKDGWVTCEDPRPVNQAQMSRSHWRR